MAGGASVDGSSVRHLLRKILVEKEEEEKEKEEEQNGAMVRAHLRAIHSSSWYQEKEEKRRKKKGRRESFLKPSLALLFARAPGPDAWHHGRFGPDGPLRRFVAVLFVDNGTGMCLAGFPGDAAPRAVFLFLVVWPKMLRMMAGMTQKDCCLKEYLKIGFYWEITSYVSVFSFFWFDSGYICMSVHRGLVFHALREGGPRTLVLRSIPSFAGGFWRISHIFKVKVDVLLRWIHAHASVQGHFWTNFLTKVDSDPVHEVFG